MYTTPAVKSSRINLFIRGGFKHIRGVDKDDSNCYYCNRHIIMCEFT